MSKKKIVTLRAFYGVFIENLNLDSYLRTRNGQNNT